MTKTKLALSLIGSFAAGSGIGVLLTKNYFEKKYEKMASEAIQDARVALAKRTHRDNSEESKMPETMFMSPEEARKELFGDDSDTDRASVEMTEGFDEFGRQKDAPDFDPTGYSKYHSASPDANKPSLEELARRREEGPNDDGSEFGYDKDDPNFIEDFTKGDDETFEEDAPRLDDGQRDADPSGKAPYIITEHEYVYGDRSFSKVCMTYYEKDKVLCDDDGSPVDVNKYIGGKAVAKLREDDAVYVRNERLGVDIEVVAIDEWFMNPGNGYDDDKIY